MQLIVLDSDTLKIVLSMEESEQYGLSEPLISSLSAENDCCFSRPSCGGEELSADAAALRVQLRSLLEEAGRRCGFDLIERRILVRFYPTVSGGYELYVSTSSAAPSKKSEKQEAPDMLCRIDSLHSALQLKLALSRLGFQGKCELYLDARGSECFFRVIGKHPPILGEFGQVLTMSGEALLPWLTEHCKRLPDAEPEPSR
jgi:hypothetical protein